MLQALSTLVCTDTRRVRTTANPDEVCLLSEVLSWRDKPCRAPDPLWSFLSFSESIAHRTDMWGAQTAMEAYRARSA